MTRCVRLPAAAAVQPLRRCVLQRIGTGLAAMVLFNLGLTPATAQERVQRQFPAQALRGALLITDPPDVRLNGAPARLAPGARIRGSNNLLVLSGAVVGQNLLVHYTRELDGLIKDVWILRPDEAARFWPRSAAEAAAYSFDPVAQTWTR